MAFESSGGVGEQQESFALEPLEASALDRQQERRRRKRRLIIDEQKNIGGDEMKANMADYSYVTFLKRIGGNYSFLLGILSSP